MDADKLVLDAKKIALIVVDMQNGFLDDKGFMNKMGLPITNLKPMLQPVKRLIDGCRNSGVPIIFTRYILRPDYVNAGTFGRLYAGAQEAQALAAGTWDVELHPDLEPQPADYIVDKPRYSAFVNTDLEILLKGLHADTVVLCGVTTEICVESTARDAFARDYWVVMVKDAMAAVDMARHDATLLNFEYGFGPSATVDEVIDALP